MNKVFGCDVSGNSTLRRIHPHKPNLFPIVQIDGVSVNHLVSILIALFGGWIWYKLGIETLFVLSALLGLCNSAYAATIKSPAKANAIQ